MSSALVTSRLKLRRWKESDLIPFRVMNADPRMMEFYPGTLTDAQSDDVVKRAEKHFEAHGFGLFAVEVLETGEFIGFVGLQNVPFEAAFTPAIEIGWRIAFEKWNQGYATEAAQVVLEYARQELKLPEVIAMTYAGNHRSRRVMEKLGMIYDPTADFENPHPSLVDSWLKPHVLYRTSWEAKN
ncbi:MAG: GNAT family N-acetyltransferase [Bdellovibrionaceae bacterium]|nr:GNAT family N-acetyltransferase [Bdellovibrionales bacterium]MCB9254845.1 GNAT family N-acetyltransferase [Pseudobdellovibrionaceae bacterium]